MLLYIRPADFESKASSYIDPSNITNFDVPAFASACGLGDPVAGNYFLTEAPSS